MEKYDIKRLTLSMSTDLFKKLRVESAKKDMSMSRYVQHLIQDDLDK